ncbi:unnamed protein product [Symbiodinium microadriaticum]|nr:unnamed protein product [Symbiodinium microadriaticum]
MQARKPRAWEPLEFRPRFAMDRAKRSRLRKALRSGQTLPKRHKWLLAAHHATPPEQAIALMGRGGRAKPWKDETGRYELWRGSWSPALRDPSQRPWRRSEPEAAAQHYHFPSYTEMQPQAVDRTGTLAAQPGATQGGRAQSVQSLLNPARKAEQRLQRLQAARSKTAAQFETFLQGLKKSFVKELTRFQNDTQRIDQAIEDATQEQERAFSVVRQAILSGVNPPGDQAPQHFAEDAWEQMRTTWEQADGDLLQEVMRRGSATRSTAPAAPRQLTPEAQQLLAQFGATHMPFAPPPPASTPCTAPTAPLTTAPSHSPTMPMMSKELQQLLQHFGAAGFMPTAPAPPPPEASAGVPSQREGDGPGPSGFYNGLDPALFEPTAGPTTAVLGSGEHPQASSVSPGARARRALAAGTSRQSVKKHTKPKSPSPGQASLCQKLEVVREAAVLKEAAAQAFLHSQQAAAAAQAEAASKVSGSYAPPGSSGPSGAMRPFGRPTVLGPPVPKSEVPTPPPAHVEPRQIAIVEEEEPEADMDEDLQDPH